jgi:hypothetical protein
MQLLLIHETDKSKKKKRKKGKRLLVGEGAVWIPLIIVAVLHAIDTLASDILRQGHLSLTNIFLSLLNSSLLCYLSLWQ